MKRYIVFLVLAGILVGGAAFLQRSKAADMEDASQSTNKSVVTVTTQALSEGRSAEIEVSYPGTIASEQETELTAGAAGTVAGDYTTLGRGVAAGALLFSIDDTTNGLTREEGWKSAAIQQAQIAEEIARKNYALAKRTYKDSKTQANRTARDVAKLQYENAQIVLQNLEDTRRVRAPFSGVVTEKLVESGEVVTAGQHVATISRSGKLVVKFFVDQSVQAMLAVGQPVSVVVGDAAPVTVSVSRIAPSADEVTRRFLVEAVIDAKTAVGIRSGTVVRVELKLRKQPLNEANFIVPISILTTGQNETYLFVDEQGVARKHVVNVERIFGEWAEIRTNMSEEARVIVDGSKLVQDGTAIQEMKE